MGACRGGARRALVLICLLVLAACAPDGDAPSKSAEPDAGSGSTSPSADEESPALTTPRFETPSGNILCEAFTSSLVCVIGTGLVPEPSFDFCGAAWIGVYIEVGRFAGPGCSGDPGISRDAAVTLEYGTKWALGGVTCLSEATGLTCRDGAGNGFTLAKAGWSLLGKEAAAKAAFSELRSMVRTQARSDLPGQVASVDPPLLRAGDDCGELQQAFVSLLLTDGRPVIYVACYVSGTWHITEGPLFPD